MASLRDLYIDFLKGGRHGKDVEKSATKTITKTPLKTHSTLCRFFRKQVSIQTAMITREGEQAGRGGGYDRLVYRQQCQNVRMRSHSLHKKILAVFSNVPLLFIM